MLELIKINKTIKKLIFVILFVILFVVSILLCIRLKQYDTNMNNINYINNFKNVDDYPEFSCFLKLTNIDPKFVNNYTKLDGKIPKCGPCQNAKLKVKVLPCMTDSTDPNNLMNKYNCKQTAYIATSEGLDVNYYRGVNPTDLNNFFCLS